MDIGLSEFEAVNFVSAAYFVEEAIRRVGTFRQKVPSLRRSARRRGVRPPLHGRAEALAPFCVICRTVDDARRCVNSYGARRGRLRTGPTALGPHGPAHLLLSEAGALRRRALRALQLDDVALRVGLPRAVPALRRRPRRRGVRVALARRVSAAAARVADL